MFLYPNVHQLLYHTLSHTTPLSAWLHHRICIARVKVCNLVVLLCRSYKILTNYHQFWRRLIAYCINSLWASDLSSPRQYHLKFPSFLSSLLCRMLSHNQRSIHKPCCCVLGFFYIRTTVLQCHLACRNLFWNQTGHCPRMLLLCVLVDAASSSVLPLKHVLPKRIFMKSTRSLASLFLHSIYQPYL